MQQQHATIENKAGKGTNRGECTMQESMHLSCGGGHNFLFLLIDRIEQAITEYRFYGISIQRIMAMV